MKIKSSVKVKERGDKIVRRKNRLYLINKQNPKRKIRQR